MSPLLLRRYRAERLLRQEFETLRTRVLTVVGGKLRARGVQLDGADLESCYSQAFQGLHAAVLDGEQIGNHTGWLVLVTFRRALDEHRSRHAEDCEQIAEQTVQLHEHSDGDLAEEIDDRARLRQLFEGLRGRLSARERQAASLCYLQGLSRAEAAAQLGISEARMRKLMEGNGKGPGVAGKVGELLETIRAGGWCEQQSSLMRGLAFGILDPDGERYRLAQLHRRECPACRAYVLSLRGLASVLPPPALPLGLGAGVLAGSGAGAGAGAAVGGGSAAGAAGAGGGWLLAGGQLGAKLAVGCAMALGLGAGCVALTEVHGHTARHVHAHKLTAEGHGASGVPTSPAVAPGTTSAPDRTRPGSQAHTASAGSAAAGTHKAQREFGPEQALAHVASTPRVGPTPHNSAVAARASRSVNARASRSVNAATREFGAG